MGLELRAFEDGDRALLERWLYAEHVASWYEHPAEWLYEVENRRGEFCWIRHFIAVYEGRPIGFCQYYEYCRSGETWHGDGDISGAYSIDYLIGEMDCLGKGLGAEMISALVEMVSACEDAERIIVKPERENKASRAALLKAGFEYDGGNDIFSLRLD